MFYAIILNNEINGKCQCFCSGEGVHCIEITREQYDNLDQYMYNSETGTIVLDPDYEEKQRQREQEVINKLNLTKADFWIALLDRDITKSMVKAKIELISDEKLKAKTLIRLDDADHFWRSDPSMNVIGAMFGITPEDLNYLFINGELPKINVDTNA